MIRATILMALLILPLTTLAAPAPPPTDRERLARDWGTFAGQGEYRFAGEQLILRSHTGMPTTELNATELCNVPRIVRTVRGDFELTLRIVDLTHPLATESQGNLGQFMTSAGLFVVADDVRLTYGLSQYYYRFPNIPNPDFLHRYVYLQAQTTNGGSGWGMSQANGKSTYLRIKRQGDSLTTSSSFDGEEWTGEKNFLANQNIVFPDEVAVGVFVSHNTKQVVQAIFDRFTLTQPPRNKSMK